MSMFWDHYDGNIGKSVWILRNEMYDDEKSNDQFLTLGGTMLTRFGAPCKRNWHLTFNM